MSGHVTNIEKRQFNLSFSVLSCLQSSGEVIILFMHVKREISTSNMNSMSDSMKRLAVSHDGHPIPQQPNQESAPKGLTLKMPTPDNSRPILSVMSNAQDDFMSRYDIIGEIGKGGFSTVYHCRKKNTNEEYAVKVRIIILYEELCKFF